MRIIFKAACITAIAMMAVASCCSSHNALIRRDTDFVESRDEQGNVLERYTGHIEDWCEARRHPGVFVKIFKEGEDGYTILCVLGKNVIVSMGEDEYRWVEEKWDPRKTRGPFE